MRVGRCTTYDPQLCPHASTCDDGPQYYPAEGWPLGLISTVPERHHQCQLFVEETSVAAVCPVDLASTGGPAGEALRAARNPAN